MKLARLFLILILVILVLGAGSAHAMQLSPASGEQRSADRDAIRSHIDKIFRAYIQKDAKVIRATHANEWTGFQSGSRTAIHGIGEYMKDVQGFLNAPVKMTGYKMLEFDVVFYGNVGIVTYIADVTYDYQGQSSTRKLRVLDVYAKLADGWNQVGSDTTLHPDTLAAELQQAQSVEGDDKQELLSAREAVWRAWFANDGPRLAELVPPELIAIEQSEKWENRDAVLAGAKDFAAKGGKLVRLEFPQTEIQMFGYTAILYSKYVCEIEMDGKRSTQSGRATEMFVNRQGKWVNVGWHLDSGS
jgi:ketosteroid isomerase-like protein